MIDFLYSVDRSIFFFINLTFQNALFDLLMPFLTDLNQKPPVLVAVFAGWIVLVLRGGREARIAALLLVPTIVLSDQLSSSVFKHLFDRPRPCHVLTDVHLLVSCGSGFSFPSSHAVNNFAGAAVFAFYLRKWKWWFVSFAAAVAFSRVYVGVHYPSDILGGAGLGVACGALVIFLYQTAEQQWVTRKKKTE